MTDDPQDDAALFRRLSFPPSAVAERDRPWGLIAGGAGVVVLGALMFASLNGSRLSRRAAAPVPVPVAAPPQIVGPIEPPPLLPPTPPPATPPAPPAAAPINARPATDPAVRLRAPAMVVDLSVGAAPVPAEAVIAAHAAGNAVDAKASADDQFAARVSGSQVDTAQAVRLRDTALVAPQGTIIPAILETGINSDLPGFVRAVVSRDVRGFDGSTVLIPRGSKLIGQYKSGVAAGQSRAFVVWSRLLTPDGISIDIGSPAVDTLGRAGVQGETNSHFLRRFGSAILLSVLSAGLEGATNHFGGNNGNTAVVIGSPQQATNVASIALQRDIDVPVTITVPQGTPIRAFVARDLDFSNVMQKPP